MTLTILSPVRGRVLPLDEVPDPVFSAGLVGPGIAVDPARGARTQAVAPIGGTVVKLHPHAYVIEARGGAAVLVHLGIDTVQLGGEGFELLVTEGTEVSAGNPILQWDPDAVEAGGRSPLCPIIALDGRPDNLDDIVTQGSVEVGDVLFHWRYSGLKP